MAALLDKRVLASQLTHHDQGLGCVAYEQSVVPPYGYRPNFAAGIVFIVAFALMFVGHCVQTGLKRKWWYLLIAVGALGT